MKIGVITFPGTLDDGDAARAVRLAGGTAVALWHADHDLRGVDAVIVPGGFSYGDYLRAGAIASLAPIMTEVVAAAGRGLPVLGICNGFQILCEAGLLPGALLRNAGLEYRCDWIHVRVEQERTPWTAGMAGRVLRMPIGHGEGCFVADPDTIASLEESGRVVFRYTDARGAATLESNPNGSISNIAGVMNEAGNVVGLMPHPERCVEALLGGTDGYQILANLTAALAGTAPAIYR